MAGAAACIVPSPPVLCSLHHTTPALIQAKVVFYFHRYFDVLRHQGWFWNATPIHSNGYSSSLISSSCCIIVGLVVLLLPTSRLLSALLQKCRQCCATLVALLCAALFAFVVLSSIQIVVLYSIFYCRVNFVGSPNPAPPRHPVCHRFDQSGQNVPAIDDPPPSLSLLVSSCRHLS